jgi:hypothetical protein
MRFLQIRYNAGYKRGWSFGFQLGKKVERERIQAILAEWMNDDNADFASALNKIERGNK